MIDYKVSVSCEVRQILEGNERPNERPSYVYVLDSFYFLMFRRVLRSFPDYGNTIEVRKSPECFVNIATCTAGSRIAYDFATQDYDPDHKIASGAIIWALLDELRHFRMF